MIHGTHDPAIVGLSMAIAVLASYTALLLGRHIRTSSGLVVYVWLATAAIAMGCGIWSMHFVTMLSYSLPGIAIRYDVNLTLVSLVIPIVVTGIGFWVVRHPTAGRVSRVLSGIMMGIGIIAMHYTGMEAMRLPATLLYDTTLVILSVAIAVAASISALWIAFRDNSLRQKMVAAAVMGAAISGMHYTAMSAAMFYPHRNGTADLGLGAEPTRLAIAVAAVAAIINFFALTAAAHDFRRSRYRGDP